MPFIEPLSIPEAAQMLELSPARVRAMAVSGQLPAEKIGGRWLIEQFSVEQRRKRGGLPGRRFTASNAWALLVIVSDGYFSAEDGLETVGEALAPISASARSRLKRSLLSEGLEKLAPRLGARAQVLHFSAHPGELENVEKDPTLMASGISGAARYRLISGKEVDGYLPVSDLDPFVRRHVLSASPPKGNVCLRVVPDHEWRIFGGRSLAPSAAIALDLMESLDPRSKDVGLEWARSLDRQLRRDAKHGR